MYIYKLYNKLQIYDVAFGSSIYWVLVGGTNFWKDIDEKY